MVHEGGCVVCMRLQARRPAWRTAYLALRSIAALNAGAWRMSHVCPSAGVAGARTRAVGVRACGCGAIVLTVKACVSSLAGAGRISYACPSAGVARALVRAMSSQGSGSIAVDGAICSSPARVALAGAGCTLLVAELSDAMARAGR